MDERRYSSWKLEKIAIGDVVRLRLGTSTIGRHSSSTIRILDSGYASRHHAEIDVINDTTVTIKDLGSVNGIFINTTHYTDNQTLNLQIGDKIGIGVSTDGNAEEDDFLPIYELKYEPIRRGRQPQLPPNPIVQDGILTQSVKETEKKEDEEINKKQNGPNNKASCSNDLNNRENGLDIQPFCSKDVNKESNGTSCNKNVNMKEIGQDDKPSCSKDVNKELKEPKKAELFKTSQPKPMFHNDIHIISDDDDDDDYLAINKIKENEVIENPQEIKVNIKKEKIDTIDNKDATIADTLKNILNINENISSLEDPDYINPSQKTKSPILAEEINNEKESESSLTNQKESNGKTDQQAKADETNQDNNLHVPIISNLKKELIRSVSADIQNIFGETDNDEDDVVQSKLKETNPLIYNELNGKPLIPTANIETTLHNGDFIILTDDDDDEDEEELGKITAISKETKENNNTSLELTKSPNIFDTSLNDSKEEDVMDNQTKEKSLNEPPKDKDTLNDIFKEKDNFIENLKENNMPQDGINLDDYLGTNYVPNSDDEDIEDLMFSQVMINDMKAELQDNADKEVDEIDFQLPNINNFSDLPSTSAEAAYISGHTIQIKQEPGLELQHQIPQELHNSCWIISDDEDYDEDLEEKTNNWTNKLFSQSFQNSMSQVYDLNEADTNDDDEEDDDQEDDLNMLDDDIDNIADFYNNTPEKKPPEDDEINDIFLEFENTLKNLDQESLNAKETNNEIKEKDKTNKKSAKELAKIDLNEQFLENAFVDILEKHNKEQKIYKENTKEKIPDKINTSEIEEVNDMISNINEKLKNLRKISNSKEITKENKLESDTYKITENELKKPKILKICLERIDEKGLPQEQIIETRNLKEKSPDISDINGEQLTESPLIRKRSFNKNKPVITSSSSEEDEVDEDPKISTIKKTKENSTKAQNEESSKTIDNSNKDFVSCKKPEANNHVRLPPPVIDAPSLPKNKGKLRGVSAEKPKHTSTASTSSGKNQDAHIRDVSAEKPKHTSTASTSSAKNQDTRTKLCAIRSKIQQENFEKELKRKWMEKPSMIKKRDRENKKINLEERKEKLKKLTEKKENPTKENIKRKITVEDQHHEHNTNKKMKVKVTAENRGAFLAKNEPTLPPPPATAHRTDSTNQFKIPKVLNKKSEPIKRPSEPPKNGLKRANSIDCLETFSQQLTKSDELLFKRQNSDKKYEHKSTAPPPLRRHSITEPPKQTQQNQSYNGFKKPAVPPLNPLKRPATPPICKDALKARNNRTTNKITFASMQKNIVENEENKRKLHELTNSASTPSPLTPSIAVSSTPDPFTPPNVLSSEKKCHNPSMIKTDFTKPKKKVRFIDAPPNIRYIERISGSKKVINKDVMPLSTNKDRRYLVRSNYPIIDNTDAIITKILNWSNEWLIKRNAAAEAASDVIYPMPQQFNSFEHYKSIIIPLMKLEFISDVEREYQNTYNIKNIKVTLEYVTDSNNKDRLVLITNFNYVTREQVDSSLYDLVLLESDKKGPKIFAYLIDRRKLGGNSFKIVYEIIAKNFTKEYFKAIKEFNVRPVFDKVRVHFGAFNAIYQLEATPLYQKIINPLELLKCKPPPKKKIQYRGCDPLNEKQKQVLLNTYYKIIDETTPNITLLQGPPGTGKSCVITNLALQTLYGEEVRYLDKKILICGQSNAAVDVIAGKLYAISLKMRTEIRFRLIRFGMIHKIHPDVLPVALQTIVEHDQLKKAKAKNNLQSENKENLKTQILQLEAVIADMNSRNIKGTVEEDRLLEKQRQLTLLRGILNSSMRPEDERSLHTWYLSNANIICCTLSSLVKLFQYVNYFDICIIDEATQCIEPFTLIPLKFGINSLVLVGDTQQLPATVISKKANELGLGTSLFTRIQNCLDNLPSTSVKGNGCVTTPNNIICGLQTQYRMNPEICKWPNQYFYKNELINGKITMDYKTPILPFCILNLAYTQNGSGSNGKITNNLEAEFVAKLLKALDGFIPNKYNSYGVITPYAHHRTTLETSLRSLGLTNIMVNTIDSYQGLEKDVIIISNARTSGIGFLSNPQRLNVALTRPKKCLILCGNFKNFETVPAWRCLLENARERKVYHEISTNCVSDIQANVINKILLKNNK